MPRGRANNRTGKNQYSMAGRSVSKPKRTLRMKFKGTEKKLNKIGYGLARPGIKFMERSVSAMALQFGVKNFKNSYKAERKARERKNPPLRLFGKL